MAHDTGGAAASFYDAAPMAFDRTEGWAYFRGPGDVYERDGLWYLTSPQAVRFAHQHPEIFSSAKAFDSLGSPVPLIPIAIDPPAHVRYRRLLDPMLAPRVIGGIEDELRRQVREIIGEFAGRGSCDVMADLAKLYPAQVIMTLFGLPLEDRDTFIAWTKVLVGSSGGGVGEATPEQMEAGLALFSYLQEYIDEKRATPADDMLSRVLSMEGEDAWTNEEILGLCFLFILAGLDTVTAAIGFVLRALGEDPGLRARIAADPQLTGPLVEEVLRLELPAPMTPRVTTQAVEVCGTTIPSGAYAFLCLATVNRQDRDHPDSIDLGAGDRGHMSFGGGIHRCLGSHLARRELRIVVEEWLSFIPDFTLAEGVRPAVHWPSGTLHYESLPVIFPATVAASPVGGAA
ncbi:cytochrome P450 [Acidiferrimicrobium sp. IK]|uniref:cytochrome P450 n=1 Tax=Acidiferrimicrobium sp. IK TaxID=2871700 RepID=UPI0021CB05C1|nr:cytochrome P450 [Acidiferrimicrobium sp. IK]MCU4183464.1 cytochrome P450 [Acidiferrimicrobium sp. IK]